MTQAKLEQAAREWLLKNGFYDLDTLVDALVTLLAAQRAAVMEAAIEIALRNTYMSKHCDDGGNWGGPISCEYGCGNVIAQAIRKLAQEQRP